MNLFLYALSLPKSSIYRRLKLKLLRREITASMLCAFVFWAILGLCLGVILVTLVSFVFGGILR